MKQLVESFLRVVECISELLIEATWDFRRLPYSYDHYRLLSHEGDSKLYREACKKLNSGSKRETFVIHTGEEITIFRS